MPASRNASRDDVNSNGLYVRVDDARLSVMHSERAVPPVDAGLMRQSIGAGVEPDYVV